MIRPIRLMTRLGNMEERGGLERGPMSQFLLTLCRKFSEPKLQNNNAHHHFYSSMHFSRRPNRNGYTTHSMLTDAWTLSDSRLPVRCYCQGPHISCKIGTKICFIFWQSKLKTPCKFAHYANPSCTDFIYNSNCHTNTNEGGWIYIPI